MSVDLQVASTSDSLDVVQAVASNSSTGTRIPAPKPDSAKLDGSSTVAYEHPESERQLLLQRLAQEEQDADRLINPEDDAGTVVISNDVTSEEGGSSEPADVPAQPTTPLPADHEHWDRMREAQDFYGAGRMTEILQSYLQAGVDLLPGLCKQVAELPNSAHVVMALMRDPNAIAYLNELAETKPGQAERDLQKISAWLTGELEEQKAAKPGPPAPIRPLGGSSTKSSVPIDELPFQDFKREREKQIKAR
jgi:hypothetical protein